MTPLDVLMVDDNERYLKIFKIAFDDAGFNLCCASCPKEALKILTSRKFDIVITDYEMARMNGLEFAKSVREINLDVPIIMITGSSLPDIASSAKENGISKLLHKPVIVSDVLNIVRERGRKNQ